MNLKFALRNLYRRGWLNLIKILGLSLAFSGILLITLFLQHELSYDSYHEKSDRIFRYTYSSPGFFSGKHFARVNNPVYLPEMKDYFPEIENYVRMAPVRGGTIKYNERYFDVDQAFECDSTFFAIFDANLLIGDPETILDNPGMAVVTEDFAQKVFGDENPVGKTFTLPGGQFYASAKPFTIQGVMKDFPGNSHFHPEFIASPTGEGVFRGWAWTYLLLSENADPQNISKNFKQFFIDRFEMEEDAEVHAHLQALRDIHLHSAKLREIEANSSMTIIYTMAAAAIILLIIALVNYANLNIGMAVFSEKYLYLSKVMGASRRSNLNYFLLEGSLISLISVGLTIILAIIASTSIRQYFGLDLLAGNTLLFAAMLVLFLVLVIFAGAIPLLQRVIAKIHPALDYAYRNHVKSRGMSKSLMVVQYTVLIVLIAAVLVISLQTNYAIKKGMGAQQSNLIVFENVHSEVQTKFSLLKAELEKYSSVEYVSAMFEPPGGEANDMFPFTMEGYEPDETVPANNYIGVFPCDYDFARIFDLHFLAGRNFSKSYTDTEGSGEYIINETAMKRLGYADPKKIIGKEFDLAFDYGDINIPSGTIIGVVEDFHLSTLRKQINPFVLFKRKQLWLSNFLVTYAQGKEKQAIQDMEEVWNRLFPGFPFRYEQVEAMYRNVYKTELLQARLLSLFTFIALFSCSMGLLGLTLLLTQRRTKEIGIRKVNGASSKAIVWMLNRDILKWLVLAFALAIPLAYYGMSKWLENFAYSIALHWWIFGIAGLAALLISWLTISYNSWRAAGRNPVEALRYE